MERFRVRKLGLGNRTVSARFGDGSFGRRHRSILKIETILLMVAVLSPLWVMPLSSPVFSDVVVVMHHDSEVSTAVRIITANDPGVRVIEYGSLDYTLTMHRTAGRVVWVSHGSETGILAGSQSISWRAFSSRTEMTPGRDIVLACYSASTNRYVAEKSVIGFAGAIDAILGGLVVSYLLVPHENALEKVYERVVDIIQGTGSPQEPLYLIEHLTEEEAITAVVSAVTIVVGLLIGEAAGIFLKSSIAQAAVRRWQITVGITLALVAVVLNVMPWSDFVTGHTGDIMELIQDTLNNLAWWDWLILIGLAIVGGIADAFGYKLVSAVLIFIDIAFILGTLWIDLYD